MLAILNSLNAHNLPIFQLILMILVSKFMVQRALSVKTIISRCRGIIHIRTPILFVAIL